LIMNFGLLSYIENKQTFNIGDNIQSLAAKQFLPRVDIYLNREKLGEYTGVETKLIMNGWFTHNIHNWVPGNNIKPLFVSFHINNTAAPYMLSEKGISYLKQHQPIGCRDQFSVDILKEKGIDAYFTGCLTLTLDSYKVPDSERGNDIYIVDPLYSYPTLKKIIYDFRSVVRSIFNQDVFKILIKKKHLNKLIDKHLLKSAKYIKQELPAKKYNDDEKFEIADDLLRQYARAKLVITSRIHCALPCLALGTPVIFVNGFDKFVDTCRFDGILDLFNRVDVNARTGEFTANFALNGKITETTIVKNLERHHALAEALKEKCREFISGE